MAPDTTLSRRTAIRARPPLLRQLAQAGGQRLMQLLNEHRWTVVGLLLAQAMVVSFYLILVHNVIQVELKRAAAESAARERHGCALLQVRLMRDQCLARLSIGKPVEVLAVGVDPQR